MRRFGRAFRVAPICAFLVGASLPAGAGLVAEKCFGHVPTVSGSAGNDYLVGTSGSDIISAAAGDDVVLGKGGNDILCGGDGSDVLSGGPGIDFSVGGGGLDTVRGDAGSDWIFDVDPTIEVGPLLGIIPQSLDESPDALIGGPGRDFLSGEGGDDNIHGGSGRDVVHALTSTVPVIIDLADGVMWSSIGGLDTIQQVEDAVGSVNDDVIVGDEGSNSIGGLFGSDRLSGGAGSDIVFAALSGSQVAGGGDAGDMLWISRAQPVRVDLVAGTARSLEEDGSVDAIAGFTDVLGTPLDDVLIGDRSGNEFLGAGGSDRLLGGDGDDVLVADGPTYLLGNGEEGRGPGRDFLDGGDGRDVTDGGPRRDGCVNGEKERSCEGDEEPADSSCADPDPDCTWPAARSTSEEAGILVQLLGTDLNGLDEADLDFVVEMLALFVPGPPADPSLPEGSAR